MLNPNLFVNACADLLGLKKPVEIRMYTKAKRKTQANAGWYEPVERKGKVIGHRISINLETVVTSDYNIQDVIAHEMCHAAQFEHNIFDENHHHDKKFQKLAQYVQGEMKKLGVTLGELYSQEIDTD